MTVTAHRPRLARGPVQPRERALAPDLARGAMLLLIALANGAGAFFGTAPGVEQAAHGLERAYNIFMFSFVHARAFPMFAIMFGYGLVQLACRQDAAGSAPGAVRAVLLRRHAWLVAFGLVHGVLLYSGDILGAYGLIGIVFTLVLLRRSDRVYRVVLWLWGAAMVAYTLVLAGLAAWAARRRVLEEPANHRRMLRWVAVVGIGTAVAGGLPMGLLSAGLLDADASAARWMKLLYEVSGTFGGAGYVALFGLLALTLSKANSAPRSPVVGAIAALGQRSLSGYLFQSIAWLVLASPFALALGQRSDSPTFAAAGCAVAVWLITVVGASLMQRRVYRGPAEILLRRLTYGPR